MKRFFALVSSLIALAVIVAVLTIQKPREQNPVGLVPGNAVMIVDWLNPAGAVQEFFHSPLGRSVASIHWPRVLKKLDVPLLIQAQIQYSAAALQDVFTHPLLHDFFSKRAVLALLPFTLEGNGQQTIQRQLAEHLLLIVQTEHKGDSSHILASLHFTPRVQKTSTYQGVIISALGHGHDAPLYIARVGQCVVISPGIAQVKKTIDIYLQHFVREETGLLLNPAYMRLKKRARGRDDFFVYTDMIRLKSLIGRMSDQLEGEPSQSQSLNGVERIAFFRRQSGATRHFTSIVQFHPESLDPFQRAVYSRSPVINYNFKRVPANLLIHVWSNWLDLQDWWRMGAERGGLQEQALTKRFAGWLTDKTGLDMESLAGLFGDEISLIITDIHTSGFIPVPRICFCVEVTDSDRVAGILEKMVANMPIRRDKIAGVPVVSIMAANGLMQPSYALVDGFLVLADSRSQIKEMLHQKTARLVNDATFQIVDSGASRPSNLTGFARIAKLVSGLKEFFAWCGTVMAVRHDAVGAKSGVLIDQVLEPLLDGMKMYRAQGLRCVTAPGEIVVDSIISVARSDERSDAERENK